MTSRGLLFALTLTAGCAAQPRWSFEPVTADLSKYPGAEAIMLSDHGRVRFLSSRTPAKGHEIVRRKRILIREPAGRRHGRDSVALSYWTRLLSVEGCSYPSRVTETRRVECLRKEDLASFARFPGPGRLYSDHRLTTFDIPGADVDRVVEIETRVRDESGFGVLRWIYEEDVPILESSFEIELPPGWKIATSYSRNGAESALPAKEELRPDGFTVWSWTRTDVEPIAPEPFGLPEPLLAGHLAVAIVEAPGAAPGELIASWADVGAWYTRLSAGLDTPPAGAAEGLRRKDGESRTIEERVFRFVRDQIRYVATHEGIGALKPHSAAEVLSAGYGDCKDMSTLLIGLYKDLGVRAFPVLVGTRDYPATPLPSISAFNHMIVAIEGGPSGLTFIDATAKWTRFGALPWQIQGQDALLIKDGASERVKLPMDGADGNLEEVTWSVEGSAAENSTSEATLTLRMTGHRADEWRALATSSPARLHRALRGRFPLIAASEILELSIAAQAGGKEILVRGRIDLPLSPPSKNGSRLVPLGHFFPAPPEIRVPADRRSPVELPYPRTTVETVVIPLQASDAVSDQPKDAVIQTGAGEYRMIVSREAGALKLQRRAQFAGGRFGAESLSDLRRLTERMAEDSRSAVVFGGVTSCCM